MNMLLLPRTILLGLVFLACRRLTAAPASAVPLDTADASTLRGKVMCGYQGWFRCPGDASKMGWIHWSHIPDQLTPETLSFELWPDVSEFAPTERFRAPGFTFPDGSQAELFSSDNAGTVQRHFEWMRDYGIDGAWVQHFLVDLPGGPLAGRYESRRRVLGYARAAARRTGRVWALSYDIAGMPTERIYDVLVNDWKRMVDEHWTDEPRYLHEGGRPVVQIWGFYWNEPNNRMTAALANKLIDFFKAPGPYSAFLMGGGSWDWRHVPDPDWQKFYRRFDGYSPWNVGNWTADASLQAHASTAWWAQDKAECERSGVFWLPVVYPGFSWDNLQHQPAGGTLIPRRGGRFLWEQFHELSQLGVDSVYVAMFDEVDEGTAIFKLASPTPVQGHFVGLAGLPSDWYLRLVGAAAARLRQKKPVPSEIPISPEEARVYSTRFDRTEDPLSEQGEWSNHGADWTHLAVAKGVVSGTQTGTNAGPWRYDDSYAHLEGFPPDQEAWGKARILKPNANCHQELEILLRFTSAPHSTTGYECFARCLTSQDSYLQIVRWDGPLGKFTYLADKRGTNYGLNDGDVLKASVVGNAITVYVNGVEKARATDDTFKTGNPGIGEFLSCDHGLGIGSNRDFGFTSFTARSLERTNRPSN